MKYQLGKILRFNNSEWGFISYKKNALTVFNIKEENKVSFKVDKSTFERIYNSKNSAEISQKTIDFVLNEAKEREDLVKQLKRGVKFVGSDDKEYTLLSKTNKKISFYSKEGQFGANIGFIKSLTGEFDNDYMNHLEPVTTKTEYNALTNEEKVKIAVNYCKSCYNQEGTEFEILEIGNIISGEAFYHEVDEYYELIGLQIKFKFKFDFKDKPTTEIGFFPIYIGKVADYYPVSFEESYGNLDFTEHNYTNGLGDEIEVDKILISKNKLDKIAF